MILFKFASNPNDYLVMMWEFQDLVPSAANSSTSICDEFTGEEFHDTLLEKLDIEFEKRSMPSSVIL
jgi:hypothetical protein